MDSHSSIQSNQTQSFTDDLPVCKNTGIGFSINQVYRQDGHPQEAHSYEDRASNYIFDCCQYYAIFDGHDGFNCAMSCSEMMSAEVYFTTLSECNTDEEIKEFLKQVFYNVEQAYLNSMGATLAEKTQLTCDIPEGITLYEMYKRNPKYYEKIKEFNGKLACGTSCAIALLRNQKLYVANVGSCRVLLCQSDENNVLKVIQLTVDHDLKNEDELLRISQLGINVKKLKNSTYLGNQESTRCLGNCLLKVSYKENEFLHEAIQEPVTAEPDILGGITLDESNRFLLLMSSGLYKSIEEATGTTQVNQYIAQCVVKQFREQSTLTGVAQAVVDQAVRLHRDWCMSNTMDKSCPRKREDMTLVLRNFNFALPNALKSPIVTFNPIVQTEILSNHSDERQTLTGTGKSFHTNSTSSSEEAQEGQKESDSPQKIDAYVDFSQFYTNFKLAKERGDLPGDIDWE